MALEQLRLIVLQAFISNVIASYAPYVQYAGTPYPIPAYVTSYPVQSYGPSPTPVYAQQYPQPASNYQPSTNLQPYKTPAKPVGTTTSYTQTGATYQQTHAPVPAIPSTASPAYQPTAYQVTPHQQPLKTPPVSPPPPNALKPEPIKPAPVKETSSISDSSPKDPLSGTSPPFDSNVLNNLAIALQLLIVSNLIHNPPLTPEPNPALQAPDEDIFPAIDPLPIAYIPPSLPELSSYSNQHIPNANFLGTSSFGDTGISKSMMNAYGSPTLPSPRPMGLMSPYDAIGPNSPFIDAFQTKREPSLPYHLASDYKDLFSLTELFKI